MGRVFVIGDLHGCVDELDGMLDAIGPTSSDRLCFLGDYVDRGPSAKGVIDRLVRLRDEGVPSIFLKGNHEDMFLAYLGYPGRYGDAFLANGGDATLESYGIRDLRGAAAAERLPAMHREFLHALVTRVSFGSFLCVHAGVRPTQPLEAQVEEDLLWIREDFILNEHPFPYTVLFGHTPHREVLLHLPFKLGLDTGLVYGNKLSCFELEGRELWQMRRGGRCPQVRSLAEDFARGVTSVA